MLGDMGNIKYPKWVEDIQKGQKRQQKWQRYISKCSIYSSKNITIGKRQNLEIHLARTFPILKRTQKMNMELNLIRSLDFSSAEQNTNPPNGWK